MKAISKYAAAIVLAVVVLALAAGSFYSIDTGERGVVLRFGKLTAVAGEGLNVKMPFVDEVKKMSIRDHNLTLRAEVSSSDIQTIAVEVGLVYSLDPQQVGRVFQTYGQDIERTLLRPTLSEKVNAVIAESADHFAVKDAEQEGGKD